MLKKINIEIQDSNNEIEEKLIILTPEDLVFDIFRKELYSAYTLYDGYDRENPKSFEECYDTRVYKHYIGKGKSTDDVKERLRRTLHDHSISVALHDFLKRYDEKKLVAVMGGHAIGRDVSGYAEIVKISKELTQMGYLMISGGGPGAMEATHLGAWMAGRSESEVDDALSILVKYPSYKDAGWMESAFEVIEKYPQDKYYSMGVPTWFYGHEPATPFATHIAKYFQNSIREDGILSIAKGGIIYTPGSAGTMQEIFQDAAQNHYETFGYSSPMVFFGVDYWTNEVPAYSLLSQLVEKGRYKNMILSVTDNVGEVIAELQRFSGRE